MRVGIVLTTYNQPAALRKVLCGYRSQSHRDFELIVADDGSGSETAAVVDEGRRAGLRIRHVWHADLGFRKWEIVNRAVAAAGSDYLIFSDGDCIPRSDFVARHVAAARPGCFLAGAYLKLPATVSEAITEDDICSGRAFRLGWLMARGWKPGIRAMRMLPPGLSALADALSPTRRTWHGAGSSTWREAIVRANGFDMDITYGFGDLEFGDRLLNLGIRPLQIRHRAVVLHLHHGRPYRSEAAMRAHDAIRATVRLERRTRAPRGIAELEEDLARPAPAAS